MLPQAASHMSACVTFTAIIFSMNHGNNRLAAHCLSSSFKKERLLLSVILKPTLSGRSAIEEAAVGVKRKRCCGVSADSKASCYTCQPLVHMMKSVNLFRIEKPTAHRSRSLQRSHRCRPRNLTKNKSDQVNKWCHHESIGLCWHWRASLCSSYLLTIPGITP